MYVCISCSYYGISQHFMRLIRIRNHGKNVVILWHLWHQIQLKALLDSFLANFKHDFTSISHLIACFINNTKSTSCMNPTPSTPSPCTHHSHTHTHMAHTIHCTPCVCGAHPLCCMTQIARRKADVGQFEYLTLHARACPALTR